MQTFDEIFSVEEQTTLKEALISGDKEAVNSSFSGALSRFVAAKNFKTVEDIEEIKKAEHARIINEQVKRPLIKKLGLKEKDFEGVKSHEIMEKAFEILDGKKSENVSEIEKNYNLLLSEKETLVQQITSIQSEYQTKLAQLENTFHEKTILLNWFSANSGSIIDAFSPIEAFEVILKDLNQKGFVLKVENGTVVARNSNGEPIFGTHNKLLSAKDILDGCEKLKALQKRIAATPLVVHAETQEPEKKESALDVFKKLQESRNNGK